MKTNEVRTLLIGLLMLCMALPVEARETPPSPGFWKQLVGGRVFFKELGITLQMEQWIPNEYYPEQERYYWEPDMEVPEGARVRLHVLVDPGRKAINGASGSELVVHMANGSGRQGWTQIARINSTWGSFDLPINEVPNGPVALRAYFDAGSQDVDAYDFVVLEKVSRQEIFQRMGLIPPLQPGDALVPEGTPTGTVIVRTVDGSVLPHGVTVLSNGQRIQSRSINGLTRFDGIPAGEVTFVLRRPDGYTEQWLLDGPPALLHQQLVPGGTVEFRLVKMGGGAQ